MCGCSRVCRVVWTSHTVTRPASVRLLPDAVLICVLDAFSLRQIPDTLVAGITASAASQCRTGRRSVRAICDGRPWLRTGSHVDRDSWSRNASHPTATNDAAVPDATLRGHGRWHGGRRTCRRQVRMRREQICSRRKCEWRRLDAGKEFEHRGAETESATVRSDARFELKEMTFYQQNYALSSQA